MDCTIPYQCPGHDCCTYSKPDDSIIYENDHSAIVSDKIYLEGNTANDINSEYQWTGDPFLSSDDCEFVSISCCHNDKKFYKSSGLVRRNSEEYNSFLFLCNESGTGCGDALITLHQK